MVVPEGQIEVGETAEQAAVREVEEETGIIGGWSRRGTIDFCSSPRTARAKTVHHFLLSALGASCPTRTSRRPRWPGAPAELESGWPTPTMLVRRRATERPQETAWRRS